MSHDTAPNDELAPAEDLGFRSRRLPGTPAGESRGMLPGMALIGMFLLILAMINTFAAMRGIYGVGGKRAGALAICTLLIVGVFGLLRLRRWGWAVVTAGCVLLATGYLFLMVRTHQAGLLVPGLFALVFFLYLVRTEVRERLR